MILGWRDRVRLAWAILRGRADVLVSLDRDLYSRYQSELERERAESSVRPGERYWMVEPEATVWVPERFPHGRNQTRLVIAPVALFPGQQVTVLRW